MARGGQLSRAAAMTNDWMLGSLYLLMAIMLVAGSLIARRNAFAKMATMAWPGSQFSAPASFCSPSATDLDMFAQRLKVRGDRRTVVEGRKCAFRWQSTATSGSKAR
jgi:aspartyl protease family protein